MKRLKYKEKIRRDRLRKKEEKEKRFDDINEIKRNWMRKKKEEIGRDKWDLIKRWDNWD